VRAALRALFAAAIAALAPERLVGGALRRLRPPPGVVVVGAGKGAAGLAAACEAALGPAVADGLVIVPPGYERRLGRIRVAVGSHPLPSRASVAATARLVATASTAGAPVLVLLTGGASSLLVAPARGVTLADKCRTTALLLASGAPIAEINAVRKHCSAIKGGELARRLAATASWAAALVVSDVPDDDPSVIASGPTVGDPTTFADALGVLAARGLTRRVPSRVRRRLERGAAGAEAETPKPGAALFARVPTLRIAGNATARAGVAAAARGRGLAPVVRLRRPFSGEPAAVARVLAARIARCQATLSGPLPAVLVAGGETAPRLGARPGRGGRNQELALEVARLLAGRPGWALLCAGTDGVDGPTDAGGAFADGATVARAERRRGAVARALARHDVYPLLDACGALFRPGPTGTNVADLAIVLVWHDHGWRLPRAVC
jgi:hydroxypyruvate reductase